MGYGDTGLWRHVTGSTVPVPGVTGTCYGVAETCYGFDGCGSVFGSGNMLRVSHGFQVPHRVLATCYASHRPAASLSRSGTRLATKTRASHDLLRTLPTCQRAENSISCLRIHREASWGFRGHVTSGGFRGHVTSGVPGTRYVRVPMVPAKCFAPHRPRGLGSVSVPETGSGRSSGDMRISGDMIRVSPPCGGPSRFGTRRLATKARRIPGNMIRVSPPCGEPVTVWDPPGDEDPREPCRAAKPTNLPAS
jgi:hypothetical protein